MDWIEILREIAKKDGELQCVAEQKEVPSHAALKINRGNVVKIEKKGGYKIIINLDYIKTSDVEEAEKEKLDIAEKYGFENRRQKGEWWKKVDDINENEIAELAEVMKMFVKKSFSNKAKEKKPEKKPEKKLGRGLNNAFLEKFKNSDWHTFFNNHQNELILGIRNNYVNIYYKCSNVVKIELKKEKLCGKIAGSYLELDSKKKEVTIESSMLKNKYETIKSNINIKQENKIEKAAQQRLILNNNSNTKSEWFCVDLEYVLQLKGEKSEYGRFDIIAITKKAPYKVALIELKATRGAIGGISENFKEFLEKNDKELGTVLLDEKGSLKNVGSLGSGVLGHTYDYVNYLKTDYYKSDLKREIIDIIKNYQELKVIDKNEFVDISEDKISEQPEIYFLTINNEKDSLRKTMYNYLCNKNTNASKYNLEKIFGVNLTKHNSYLNPIFLFSEDNGENIHDILELSQYTSGFEEL